MSVNGQLKKQKKLNLRGEKETDKHLVCFCLKHFGIAGHMR